MAGSMRTGPAKGEQEILINTYNAMVNIIPDSRAIGVLQDLILKGLPPVKALNYTPWVPKGKAHWKGEAVRMAFKIVTFTDIADNVGWTRWGHQDKGTYLILQRDGRFRLLDMTKNKSIRTICLAPPEVRDKNGAILWFRKHAPVSFMAFTPQEVKQALKARMTFLDHRVSLLMRSWNGEWRKLSPGHSAIQDWIVAYLRPMLDGSVSLTECCLKHGSEEVRRRYEEMESDGISDTDFRTMLAKGED